MFKISAALSLSALLLTGASANPLRRDSCSPNAQGNPVSIQNAATGLEWSVTANEFNIGGVSYAGLTTREWFIPQTGQYPTSYFVKYTGNGQVTTINGGELTLNDENLAIYQPNQVFTITCNSCGADASPGNVLAEGCVISPVGVESCISIGPDAGIDALHNLGCTPGAPTPNEVYTLMT